MAIIFSNGNGSKFKTKVRRLYDITNVFKAIGLVKKKMTKEKKVAIEWLGVAGFDNFCNENRQYSKPCNNVQGFNPISINTNVLTTNTSAFNKVIAPNVENKEYTLKQKYVNTLSNSDFYDMGKNSFYNNHIKNNPYNYSESEYFSIDKACVQKENIEYIDKKDLNNIDTSKVDFQS